MNTNNLLIDFVTKLQLKYPHVMCRFEYDPEEDLYRIWHTYTEVYTDQKFCDYMGQLISEIFVPAGFFDYYIELNTQYLQAMNTKLVWQLPNPESVSNTIPIVFGDETSGNIMVENYIKPPEMQGYWLPPEKTNENDGPEKDKMKLAA